MDKWWRARGESRGEGSRHEGEREGAPNGRRVGRWKGQRETTPKPAISIGHLGVCVGSRGGSEGAPPSPQRGANVWQLKSTPSSFHLPLRRCRQPPSSSKAPRRGKNFLGVGWVSTLWPSGEPRPALFAKNRGILISSFPETLCRPPSDSYYNSKVGA